MSKSVHTSRGLDDTTRSILDHWHQFAPDDRLAHLVRDAARGLTRALQMRLSEYGISFGHWAFLRLLWVADGQSQRELSVRAGLMESTTHTAINRMEKLGLLVRRHKPGNRRKLHVYLTARGRTLQEQLVPLAEEVNDIAVEGLQPGEMEIMRRGLLAVITNLAADEVRAAERGQKILSTRDLGERYARAADSAERR